MLISLVTLSSFGRAISLALVAMADLGAVYLIGFNDKTAKVRNAAEVTSLQSALQDECASCFRSADYAALMRPSGSIRASKF